MKIIKYILIFLLTYSAYGQTPPVASFTLSADTICAKGKITFTDLSTGIPYFWVWSIPGATPSSSGVQNPVFLFPNAGSYAVTLTVINDNGSSSASQVITVIPGPTVTASATRTIIGKNCDPTTLTGHGALSYTWHTNQNDSSITFFVHSVGVFTFYVVGSNSQGCTDTAKVVVKVNTCGSITEDNIALSGISLQPNPNNGSFVIHSTSNNPSSFILFNCLGEMIKIGNSNEDKTIDLYDEPAGIYFLELSSGKATKIVKLIRE